MSFQEQRRKTRQSPPAAMGISQADGGNVNWTKGPFVQGKTEKRPTIAHMESPPIAPEHVLALACKRQTENRASSLRDTDESHRRRNMKACNAGFYAMIEKTIKDRRSSTGKDDPQTDGVANDLATCKNHKGEKRMAAYERLKLAFPELWEKSSTDQRFKAEQDRVKPPESKAKRLADGRREYIEDNIERLFSNHPKKLGVIVKKIPLNIMNNMMLQYGRPAFVKEFNSKAEVIVLSSHDQRFIDSYHKVVAAEVAQKSNKEDASTTETGTKKRKVRSNEEKKKLVEEERQRNLAVEIAKEEMFQNEEMVWLGTCEVNKRPTSTSMEGEAKRIYDEAKQKKSANSSDIEAHKRDRMKEGSTLKSWFIEEGKLLNAKYGIEPWWLTMIRSRYLLHQWYCLRDGKTSDSRREASDVIKSGGSFLDCPLLNDSGQAAISGLDSLVKEVMQVIFEKDGGKEKMNYNGLRSSLQCAPGIIKTGMKAVHQDIHIDNRDLLGKTFLENVIAGDYDKISDESWLKGGYVVDMPLSSEGSWLRVALPDKGKEEFILQWVYIPFGSFLIRSMALFHSGHYGSPGNTRFHSVNFLKGDETNTAQLGYLYMVTSGDGQTTGTRVDSLANGWKVNWTPEVDERFRDATMAPSYKNKEITRRKQEGTMYAQMVMNNPYAQLTTLWWMLNPLPECTSFGETRHGEEGKVGEEKSKVKQEASGTQK
jgi:hypothetical protein